MASIVVCILHRLIFLLFFVLLCFCFCFCFFYMNELLINNVWKIVSKLLVIVSTITLMSLTSAMKGLILINLMQKYSFSFQIRVLLIWTEFTLSIHWHVYTCKMPVCNMFGKKNPINKANSFLLVTFACW